MAWHGMARRGREGREGETAPCLSLTRCANASGRADKSTNSCLVACLSLLEMAHVEQVCSSGARSGVGRRTTLDSSLCLTLTHNSRALTHAHSHARTHTDRHRPCAHSSQLRRSSSQQAGPSSLLLQCPASRYTVTTRLHNHTGPHNHITHHNAKTRPMRLARISHRQSQHAPAAQQQPQQHVRPSSSIQRRCQRLCSMSSLVATRFAPPVALYLQLYFEAHPAARKVANLVLKHARKHSSKYSPDLVLSYVLNYSFKYSVAYLVKYFLGSMFKRILHLLFEKAKPEDPDWTFHDT